MLDYQLEPDIEPETPEDYGYVHADNLPDFEHLRDHVQGIIDALYGSGDVKQIESCLDEVCHQLDMDFAPTKPVLERVGQRNVVMWHLGYQRALLDNMKTKTHRK